MASTGNVEAKLSANLDDLVKASRKSFKKTGNRRQGAKQQKSIVNKGKAGANKNSPASKDINARRQSTKRAEKIAQRRGTNNKKPLSGKELSQRTSQPKKQKQVARGDGNKPRGPRHAGGNDAHANGARPQNRNRNGAGAAAAAATRVAVDNSPFVPPPGGNLRITIRQTPQMIAPTAPVATMPGQTHPFAGRQRRPSGPRGPRAPVSAVPKIVKPGQDVPAY